MDLSTAKRCENLRSLRHCLCNNGGGGVGTLSLSYNNKEQLLVGNRKCSLVILGGSLYALYSPLHNYNLIHKKNI